MTLGPVAKVTTDERRREAAAVIDRIKRGAPKPACEPTVADLAERCLTNHVAVRCKPNTANQAMWVLSKMFTLAQSWGMTARPQPVPACPLLPREVPRTLPDPGGVPAPRGR